MLSPSESPSSTALPCCIHESHHSIGGGGGRLAVVDKGRFETKASWNTCNHTDKGVRKL